MFEENSVSQKWKEEEKGRKKDKKAASKCHRESCIMKNEKTAIPEKKSENF